jgi:hypothetical protein
VTGRAAGEIDAPETALVVSTIVLVGGQAEAAEPLGHEVGVVAKISRFSGVNVQDA